MMEREDINAREVVDVEFEVVWKRTVPGNRPLRSIAKYWFKQGRDHGLRMHAASERGTIRQLNARIAELEQLDATKLARRVHRLTEALTELEHCARIIRQSNRSGNTIKRDAVRVDAAIHNARKEINK